MTASSLFAGTAVPPVAEDDSYVDLPGLLEVDADSTLNISKGILLANDTGDGIGFDSADAVSAEGALVVSLNATTLQYNPIVVADFIALDSDDAPVTDTFDYSIAGDAAPDTAGDEVATVTIQVSGVNDAPSLSALGSLINIQDDETTTPFASATVSDPDNGELLTVTVTLDEPDRGALTTLGEFVNEGSGVYTYTDGLAADITADLRALVFVPVENRILPETFENTVLTVEVDDGDATPVSDTRTVRVESINDAPTLGELGNLVSIDDNETTTPFTGGSITDPDFDASVTVTVTINASDEGKLTNLGGFTNPSTGTYTFTGTPAAATTALTALVFEPKENRLTPGADDNTVLSVSVTDGFVASPVTDSRTVNVTSINDAPVLSPGGPFGTFALFSGASVKPFIGINSLTDVDYEDLTPPDDIDDDPAGDDFTATITISPSPYGTLFSEDFTGSGGSYSFTSKRVQVEAAIQNVLYQAPADGGTYTITVTVEDSHSGTSNAVVATVEVTQTTPGTTGLVLSGQQVADDDVIYPFATAEFNGFGTTRVVNVTLDDDAKGVFENLGAFTKVGASAPYVYTMTGDSVAATSAIQNLRFHPTPNRITGASEVVTFSIAVEDLSEDVLYEAPDVAVTVFPTNDAPTINSTGPLYRIDDDETETPFATISITDVDEGGQQAVVLNITLIGSDPDTNAPVAGGGVLSEAVASGLLTTSGTYPNVTYTLTGSPAAVTSALQALVFTPGDPPPAPERWSLGQSETVSFTMSVQDYITVPTTPAGGSDLDDRTSVVVTYVNGAPFINGVPALSLQPYAVAGSADSSGIVSAEPFKNLTVSDDDPTITFTITMDDADKGELKNLGSFVDNGGGVYTMTDSPINIQGDLQALIFEVSDSYVFPVNTPGLTTFTLSATDPAPASNNRTLDFTIFVREQNLAHIVTVAGDNAPGESLIAGSLREALSFAGVNDSIVFEFEPDAYPVTIHLAQPLVIEKNLSIIGSGVDQLAISGDSDDNGVGDTALFIVEEDVEFIVEQITLQDGAAPSYGGAIATSPGSRLIARYTSFINNSSGQYGGAIDVDQGELLVEGCLFVGNRVVGSTAKGGGAIAVYSDIDSIIRNSTFTENVQDSSGGLGGASIYAQNSEISGFFNLLVEHCTFSGNTDAANSGSAILSSVLGTNVQVRNNIFADDGGLSGIVLDVVGAGEFDSLGGNIATDDTSTTYTQGETSQNILLLDPDEDELSVSAAQIALLPLAANGGATLTMALDAGSSAIDAAVIEGAPVLDQRGVWRDATPDVGAYEAGAFQRVNINEIYVQGTTGTDFIEFYNPRDSATLDMAGLELRVDGALMHTFTTEVLTPGSGFAWTSTFDIEEESGSLELWDSNGGVILHVDYIGGFSLSGNELDVTGQSITRYTNFEGGFLPHKRIVEIVTGQPVADGEGLTSPGDDVTGAPLNGGNAPPIAIADVDEDGFPLYSILANETVRPEVLLNDIEFDRTDTLKITEVMDVLSGEVTNLELAAFAAPGTFSLSGLPTPGGIDTTVDAVDIAVTIDPDGLGLTYDPTASNTIIGLAQGETITDIWAYTMRDYDESDVALSRGADATKQEENIIKATNYFTVTVTGINEAPEATNDTAATEENQAIRLLADVDLLDPATFSFGDLDANYQDFDATGAPVTLKPPAPTVALLENDDDVDSDDDSTTLLMVGVSQTADPSSSLTVFSEKGASVRLDIRADRRETNVIYDPRPSAILNSLSAGEETTDTFYYTIEDRHGATSVGMVTVTVTGVNDVPTANDDSDFSVSEDNALDIPGADLLANDTDPDQNESGPDDAPIILEPFPTSSDLGATLSFDGTTITYDPRTIETYESLARNETLVDTFDYTIEDTFGGTSVATVTIVVEGQNDAPVADDDLLEILENDTTVVDAVDGLLSNDFDIDINGSTPDDDPWVLPQRGVTSPLGAALDINPDGSYRYDANSVAIDALIEDELAVEIFPYTVIDNSRTRALDDSFKVPANSVDIELPVLSNDAVVATVPVAVVAYSEDAGDANNTVIESADHGLRDGLLVRIEGYVGTTADYNGVYPITSMDADHFSIPVPFDETDATTGGTWQPWFTITAVSATSEGGLASTSDGQSILYTPTTDFYGEETFTYTIEDGVGGQDVATVTVESLLSPLNGTLRANDDIFRVSIDELGVEVDVLANDHMLPASGADLFITAVSPEASGVTIINGGKALSYDSPASATSEVFTYTVSGGGSVTAQATVTFEVEDRTDLLTGNDDSFFVVTGSADVVLDVLANDSNLPDFPVTPTLDEVQYAGNGSAVISGGVILYTAPPSPFLGTDTFTYTARDVSGATTTQTVRVDVVADVPNFRAQADYYRVVAGSGPVLLPVLFNDGTIQNDEATISIVNLGLDTQAPPDVSRVQIDAGQTFIQYTPPTSSNLEVFTYETSIGTIDRREAVITIEVVDSFEVQPNAADDVFDVARDSAAVTLDVLGNDLPYPDAGWEWEIVSTSGPDQGGSIEIDSGSALTYIPAEGFFGTETFSYTIEDVFGDSDTATVTVYVGELLTAPDAFAVLENSADNALEVLINDDILERYSADYTISLVGTPDQGGSVVVDGVGPNNRLLYTPLADFVGEESFTYTIIDNTSGGSVGSREETVVVTVIDVDSDRDGADLRVEITGINDIPQINGTADGATTDKETIQPFENIVISDLDEFGAQIQTVMLSFDVTYGSISAPAMSMNGPGSYSIIGTPAVVSAALQAIVFTPTENVIDYIDPGFYDLDFDLSVDDGYTDGYVEHTTTVRITPVNDAPTLLGADTELNMKLNAFPRALYMPNYFADVDDDVYTGELTWTVEANTNPALFESVAIDATKQLLILTLATDAFGEADITIRGTDRGLLFAETTFHITVDGNPIIELDDGQTQPPAPSFIPGSASGGYLYYRQSFRVSNDGVLPAEAFIIHVYDPLPVPQLEVVEGEYSTDENGTPDIFSDDTRSSGASTIVEEAVAGAPVLFHVKFDVPIPAGESVVVHLVYRAFDTEPGTYIRPQITVELTIPSPTRPVGSGIIESIDPETGEVTLSFAISAGVDYEVQSSEDMTIWNSWGLIIPADDFDREIEILDDGLYTDPHPSLMLERFYRLIEYIAP